MPRAPSLRGRLLVGVPWECETVIVEGGRCGKAECFVFGLGQ